MADIKISELSEITSPSDGDYLAVSTDIGGGVLATRKITYINLIGSAYHRIRGFVKSPNTVYSSRPQIVLARADAALSITNIRINLSSAAYILESTLKYADDITNFTNAVTISICDTVGGEFTFLGDVSVPSGKFIYLLLDAIPNTAIKDFYIEVFYTYD